MDDGFLIPRLYCLRGDNVEALVPLFFNDDEEKDRAYEQILKTADQQGVDGFIEAAESWMSPSLQTGIRPRDDPNRKEIVMMTGRQITSGRVETLVAIYDIVRQGSDVDLVMNSDQQPRDMAETQMWFDPYLNKRLESNQ